MRRTFYLAMMLIIIAAVFVGCGRKATQPTATSQEPLATSSQATANNSTKRQPLPEWAPKKPSKEFLRAAKVLKPRPGEVSEQQVRSDLSQRALSKRYWSTMPAAWEFFGTLTDQQIARFLSGESVRMRVKDLSKKQRATLERFFEVWREAFKGVSPLDPEYGEDWLVALYKIGAKEDLSNVEVVFDVRGSGIARMRLFVRRPDGSLSPALPMGLGQVAVRGDKSHAQ